MKRVILALTAAATVLGPMAAASSAAAQGWDRHDRRDHDRRYDRRDYDRRDHDRRDRRNDRWDDRRYNGYNWNGRWYYGPPPRGYYGNPGLHLGWRNWNRGDYLPPYYRSYVVYDYGRYHLRPPPRGYRWHRVGDDYVLAAIASGLIAEVLLHNR